MRGLYTEKIVSGKIPFGQLVSEILSCGERNRGLDGNPEGAQENIAAGSVSAEQFCDGGEGEVNRYNVYKITAGDKCYVLKKSDEAEIGVYERFLQGQGLPAPAYFGNTKWNGKQWILIAYVEGRTCGTIRRTWRLPVPRASAVSPTVTGRRMKRSSLRRNRMTALSATGNGLAKGRNA